MKRVKRAQHLTDAVPAELAAAIEALRERGHEWDSPPPILDPLASVEAARAFRVREGPPESGGRYVARDIETARSSTDESERGAAIGRAADWLCSRWRLRPAHRRAVNEETRRSRARILGVPSTPEGRAKARLVTPASTKRAVAAAAIYEVMTEDADPMPVSVQRIGRTGRNEETGATEEHPLLPLGVIYGRLSRAEAEAFYPLVAGMWAPGAFGWWSLYREWLLRRAMFHGERRLSEMAEWRGSSGEPKERMEEPAVGDLDAERHLAAAMAALPNEATRRLVRSLDPQVQLWTAKALGLGPDGEPLLKRDQPRMLVEWVRSDFDRERAFKALGKNYSAGQKILKRALDQVGAAGLI